ncbi:hypothetical protein [Helicobacter cappadocius]|uniref:Uncharacterized protein n=1 Tax=Helicobacter cappadocius TaxID=3063998 RepID=A0AA90PZ49_9HELI|nr:MULTISPECIES: hypothetical protein [unclassified Helicobacter]MDO7253347.1 hypothetical protein [Helicobacter sp. faydin-H75]MDP2539223.1 hypothetical protein [Helicobacter sp. faydin-H76]
MAISPIGNITYINQNSQLNSTQQANAIARGDMTDVIAREFEDKLKDVQEVRPTEDSQSVNPDSKGNGAFEEENKKEQKQTQATQDEQIVVHSEHILDIKV